MVTYAYLERFLDLMAVSDHGCRDSGQSIRGAGAANPYICISPSTRSRAARERSSRDTAAEYFDYFYDAISADPSKITAEARAVYRAGLRHRACPDRWIQLYRTFPQDAAANKEANSQATMTTRLLYLRGEKEAARSATTWTACGLPG